MAQFFCTLRSPRYPWAVRGAGGPAASARLAVASIVPWQDGTLESFAPCRAQTVVPAYAFDMTTGAAWVLATYKGAATGTYPLVLVRESDVLNLDTLLTTLTGSGQSWAVLGKVLNSGLVDPWQQG